MPVWLDTLNSSPSHDTDGWLAALHATAAAADQVELDAATDGSDQDDLRTAALIAGVVDPGPAPESLAKSIHLMRDPGLYRLGEIDISNDARLVELKVAIRFEIDNG